MLYYSTNLQAQPVTFREALLKGLAPDRGLFMPRELPTISAEELRRFSDLDYADIAFEVTRKFLYTEMAESDLLAIVKDAYTFLIPLEPVYERKYVMRLDQGPTASFKDFAARMMGRLMQYFLRQEERNLLILTATSGDTGSAIANAFYGLENIKVVVLYPEHEVTERQRKQMTTLAKNIQIIAINGKFDDCQALVKRAFADPELASLPLSSANSINIGRLLPQMLYYVYAYAKLRHTAEDEQIIFSVPSGNFGNLMGGLLAKHIGLPVKKFVVATNENDEFPVFLATGDYEKIVPSRNCISSAMNVGHPSNVARLIALYGGNMDETGQIHQKPDFDRLRKDIYAVSISDAETQETIKQVYTDHHLLLEPHGAVAWAGLSHYFNAFPQDAAAEQMCVAIETAHPAKFPVEIRQILGFDPELPPSLEGLEEKPEFFVTLPNSYTAFRQFLQEHY
ncbi:L-threonine synthase [Candidatus Vecturithrix granuli]|uniref:Threonine synthase n=1 Tax=Vecturithrix granuli TaxID=1499967 RepID=A0A081BVV8_VECG1|nr:L-threonine synthase [Candidatus Vecturithrix granuli]